MFGSIKAQRIKCGRPCSITLVMLEALCDRLLEKPTIYAEACIQALGMSPPTPFPLPRTLSIFLRIPLTAIQKVVSAYTEILRYHPHGDPPFPLFCVPCAANDI